MAPRTEKVTFEGSAGAALDARLELPDDGEPVAFALFAHCFTCGKDVHAARRISRALAVRGFGVLRFDFTGLGSSDGDFANTDFSSNVDDLAAAAEHLAKRHAAPRLLVGHSLGGAAVLAAAARLEEPTAVATIGAPAEPTHVKKLLEDATPEIEARGEACVKLGGRHFRIRRQFLDDIESSRLEESIRGMRKALLVFHSPTDDVVGIDNASKIFLAARHPKSFVSLAEADHLLSREEDALYVADVLAAWASRYVDRADASEQPRTPPVETTEHGEVLVAETREGRFTQSVSASGHPLRADEPRRQGGLDTGPSPYDFLLTALGTCTSMTLRLYAERKQLPLDRVTVRLRHHKIHAQDCEDCETREGRIDAIEREIELAGSLDEDQRRRLLEIADKCPVHRTLTSETKIRTKPVG